MYSKFKDQYAATNIASLRMEIYRICGLTEHKPNLCTYNIFKIQDLGVRSLRRVEETGLGVRKHCNLG